MDSIWTSGQLDLILVGSVSKDEVIYSGRTEKLLGGTTYFSLDSGRLASHEDGDDLSFGDLAVLYRLNAQGDDLEAAFRRAGIPLVRSGEKPLVNRYPVNHLWRLLQLLRDPENPYFLKTYLALGKDRSSPSPLPPHISKTQTHADKVKEGGHWDLLLNP